MSHIEDIESKAFDMPDPKIVQDEVLVHAEAATAEEHQMKLREGLRVYPKAIFWSCLLSLAIVMEGYDGFLMSSLFAQPAFQRKFGVELPDGSHTLTAAWQAGLSNAGSVGAIIGLGLNGWASDRFGHRRTILVSLCSVVALIFILFFAQNVQTLLAGAILLGLPFGVFQTLTTAYASEMVPTALRSYLTAWVAFCWVFGQLLAAGVLRGVLTLNDSRAYRIPFATQWIWPVPLIIGCFFAPESPWWLVRKGRIEEARRTLQRLHSNSTERHIEDALALMIHTNAIEEEINRGTSYLDCFKGTNRRRTEIACGAYVIQITCGLSLFGYSTYFMVQAGLATSSSFDMTIAQYCLGLACEAFSWYLMRHFGRRRLYLVGLLGMFVFLILIGGFGFVARSKTWASWTIGGLLLCFAAVYNATVGPVCYSVVAEIPATRLRAKTVVLARIAYCVVAIAAGVFMPYMLNAQNLNWGGKTGLFWAATCLLSLVWAYFRLPEPKNRTYGELDILFEARISARKFKSTEVNMLGVVITSSVASEEEKI